MNPLVHYRLLVATLLLQGTIFATAQGEDFRRPNVILMMTDDQGYGDLSSHRNPVLRTPHLDRLASEGSEFTQFYCCANCSPTRASLMTGRW